MKESGDAVNIKLAVTLALAYSIIGGGLVMF